MKFKSNKYVFDDNIETKLDILNEIYTFVEHLLLWKSLLFHFSGYDWKSDLKFGAVGGDSQRKFSYTAVNQAGQDVTLEEVSGTNMKISIVNGGLVQGGQTLAGRTSTEPLKYRAVGKNGKELQVNGKNEYVLSDVKSGNDVKTLVIHNSGNYFLV